GHELNKDAIRLLYERYANRIRKIFIFRKLDIKYRKLIYIITASIALLSTTFVSITVNITSTGYPTQVAYGNPSAITANALFSYTSYSYRTVGEEAWQSEKPTEVSIYELRITTKGTFGEKHSIKSFEIEPQIIELELLHDEIEHGTNIMIHSNLSYEDYIDSFTFTFDDVSLQQTFVEIDNVIIKSKDGMDATHNYQILVTKHEITFIPKYIEITL